MRRRRLLAALAALPVAGCSRPSAGDATTAERATDGPATGRTPTATEAGAPDDAGRDPETFPEDAPDRSQVTVAETTPRTYALSTRHYRTRDDASVSFGFVETATPNHPARVVFFLRNAADFANTFRLDETPPFGRGGGFGRGPRGNDDRSLREAGYRTDLVLAPTEDHDVALESPDYERASDGTWRLTTPKKAVWLPERVRLRPGEWIRGEYVLLGRAEGARYGRPTGRYEFSRRDGGFDLNVWDAESPGPESSSRFAGVSVPPFENGSVAWFHEADAATATFVRPDAERTSLPGRVAFEFVNHSRESLQCGHWNLYKLREGEWFHVAPRAHTADCRVLASGATKEQTLRAFHGPAVPCDDGLDVGHLGGGRYAMVVGYGAETGRSGALFDVDADPASVEPTDDVTAERDGEAVTVTSSRHGDGDHPPDATVTATRADSASETRLPERVMQSGRFGGGGRGIRNTVPFFESGVRRVVLRTDGYVAGGAVGHGADRRRLRVGDAAYEFAVERAE